MIKKLLAGLAATVALLFQNADLMAQPEYEIISLGQMDEMLSSGQAVSPNGQFGAGFNRELSDTTPFFWESGVGVTALLSEASRPFSTPRNVNDSGTIVGVGHTTMSGSDPLPIIWQGGSPALLGLPAGKASGWAYGINNSDLIVGSIGGAGGTNERAATFSTGGPGMVLKQTFSGGTLITAFDVNDSGRIVGLGLADNGMDGVVLKGFYLDDGDTEATDIGSLTDIGHNSAIAFDVSNAGFITGVSSLNSGVNGRAFLWSDADGMIEIDLPAGTTNAVGRGVNNDGWVVGAAGGTSAIPFLNDGKATHRLQDIITVGGTGWDLVGGASNAARGIANNGTIFGRALLDGNLTAFAMVLVDEILLGDVNCDGEINLLDVAPFVDAISTGTFIEKADINQDGFVDLLDVQPFVALLSG